MTGELVNLIHAGMGFLAGFLLAYLIHIRRRRNDIRLTAKTILDAVEVDPVQGVIGLRQAVWAWTEQDIGRSGGPER